MTTKHKLYATLRLSAFFSFALLLSACGLLESVENTNDHTAELNRDMDEVAEDVEDLSLQTKDIDSSTKDMRDQMAEMNKNIEKLYEQLIESNKNLKQTNAKLSEVAGESEEIKKELEETNQSLDGVATKILGLNSELKQINDGLKNLGTDARQGLTTGIRTQAFEALINAKSIESKLAAATTYFMAFEFQLWRNEGFDDKERKNQLIYDGVAEFYRSISGFIEENGWNLSPDGNANTMNVLYALSATIDSINSNQHLYLAPEQKTSFLSIISESIEISKKVRDGEIDIADAPAYIKETLLWEDISTYMLRLRHNFISGILLVKLSGLNQNGVFNGQLDKIRLFLFPWNIKLGENANNAGALVEFTYRMQQVITLRRFLQVERIELKTDQNLKTALGNMIIDEKFEQSIFAAHPNQTPMARKFLNTLRNFRLSITR